MSARHFQTRRPSPSPDRGDDWRDSAACIGHEATFDAAMVSAPGSSPMDWAAQTDALTICGTCPVRVACVVANRDDEWGIVGGTTPEQRRTLRNGNYTGPAVPEILAHECPTCARRFGTSRAVSSHYAQVHTAATGTCVRGHRVESGKCEVCKRGSDAYLERIARKRAEAKRATLQDKETQP